MANQTTSARTIRKIHPPRVIVIASLHAPPGGIPVTPLRVLLARLRAAFTASCQPRGEDPMILVTRATAMALPPRSEWGIGGACRGGGGGRQGGRPPKKP